MMIRRTAASAAFAALASVSTTTMLVACHHGGSSAAPMPSTTPKAPGTTTTSEGPVIVLRPRRMPPSRDSLVKLRAPYIEEVMKSIAGRENEPADQVFKNVQVLKGLTATQLVDVMNKQYSVALSWNCTNCHRFAAQGNFASDTSADKRRARFMQQMENDINQAELPKLYPRETPKVTCATCHRGYNEPPPAEYLLPERGKPGGVPFPAPRGPGRGTD